MKKRRSGLKVINEWREERALSKLQMIMRFIGVCAEIAIAIAGFKFTMIQTEIYAKQEEVARKQTLPEITIDIARSSNVNMEEYQVEFTSLQGPVRNAALEIYGCVLATVYDFSSVDFPTIEDKNNFNPYETIFDGWEYAERTIVLPIKSSGLYSMRQLIGNTTNKQDKILDCVIYGNSLEQIEHCANYDVSVGNDNMHWVCFPKAGTFLVIKYQDIYGDKHSNYYLAVPDLLYSGIYFLSDSVGKRIYEDCYEIMGKESTYDHEAIEGIDLDVFYITDDIAKREIRIRYNKDLNLPSEDIIPVFYTYSNE